MRCAACGVVDGELRVRIGQPTRPDDAFRGVTQVPMERAVESRDALADAAIAWAADGRGQPLGEASA